MDDQTEDWRPIPGWEGLYEASSQGRIRSLSHSTEFDVAGRFSKTRFFPGMILKHTRQDGKYPQVSLCRDGVVTRVDIHRVICRTFHGEPADGEEAAHRNGIKNDVRSENLRWATPLDNAVDKATHGTNAVGTRHGQAKLSEADVIAIRSSPLKGVEIAAAFRLSKAQVSRIRTGKRWRHSI